MTATSSHGIVSEFIRFVHIVGIVASFILQDAQIITWCVALTIPLALYRALTGPVSTAQIVSAISFLGCALAIAVKALPSGLGPATMLIALALVALGDNGTGRSRYKTATAALVFLALYSAVGLAFLGMSVDTVFLHSKNYLSVLGLVFYFAAEAEWVTSGQGPPRWLPIPAIGLCLLSLSLAGVLGAAGLALYLFACRFGPRKVAVCVLALSVFMFALFSLLPIQDSLDRLRDLVPSTGSWGVLYRGLADRVIALLSGEAGTGADGRLQIWSAYLNELDTMSWLTGLPRDELLVRSLHNSYLNLHMHFGLLAVALFAAWVVMIAKARLPAVILFLLSILAFRASVDSILFAGGYFDGLFLLTLRMYQPAQVLDTSGSQHSYTSPTEARARFKS